jgi:hypothetical protein
MGGMTDNIVKFPSKELDIELELDETEEEYMEMVEAINTMLEMHIAGFACYIGSKMAARYGCLYEYGC